MSDQAFHKGPLTGRDRLLRACHGRPVDRPPVWMMRQAGRYLPEYRELRGRGTFLEAVRDPETAAELTCQPVRRFGMDAAIIFCDILVPAAAMGMGLEFQEGRGPVMPQPVRSLDDVKRLEPFDPERATGFLPESIRRVRAALGEEVGLVGFCGAPFTTASYMIEGGTSRSFEHTKAMMLGAPEVFAELVERITDALVPYLGVQVEAGADVLQIFDSWGGTLDAATWRRMLFEPTQRLVCSARALEVPVVLYVNGCAHLLETLADLEPTVLGIDWRVDPTDATGRVGARCALQGNMDPAELFAPPATAAARAREVVRRFQGARGHVFNLGSGLLPGTPVKGVAAVVDAVKGCRS